MQNIYFNKKKSHKKENQQTFEQKQKEAFKQFMKAHFGDPLFQECVMNLYR